MVRNYNISPSDAYDKWYKAIAKKDERISEIIDNLIKASPEGIPVLINRNPTINYGSILQCFVVGQTDTLTMSVSLQCLKSLAADQVVGACKIIKSIFEYLQRSLTTVM